MNSICDISFKGEKMRRRNNKKEVKRVHGNLGYMPNVGEFAIICIKGVPKIYTSRVAKIRKRTSRGIEIETKESIYKIKYDKYHRFNVA